MAAGDAPPDPRAAAAALLLAVGVRCWRGVRRMCRRPRRRNPLRRCAMCRADAVAARAYETVDDLEVRVLLQCGQCGAWREVLTVLPVLARYERLLEGDRRQILRRAERLGRERAWAETRTFEPSLRDKVMARRPSRRGSSRRGGIRAG